MLDLIIDEYDKELRQLIDDDRFRTPGLQTNSELLRYSAGKWPLPWRWTVVIITTLSRLHAIMFAVHAVLNSL
jgi:hypothetical protein